MHVYTWIPKPQIPIKNKDFKWKSISSQVKSFWSDPLRSTKTRVYLERSGSKTLNLGGWWRSYMYSTVSCICFNTWYQSVHVVGEHTINVTRQKPIRLVLEGALLLKNIRKIICFIWILYIKYIKISFN